MGLSRVITPPPSPHLPLPLPLIAIRAAGLLRRRTRIRSRGFPPRPPHPRGPLQLRRVARQLRGDVRAVGSALYGRHVRAEVVAYPPPDLQVCCPTSPHKLHSFPEAHSPTCYHICRYALKGCPRRGSPIRKRASVEASPSRQHPCLSSSSHSLVCPCQPRTPNRHDTATGPSSGHVCHW